MVYGDFRLFVGLGNPGSKYSDTRHNIGFKALEKLAAQNSGEFRQNKKLHGQLAEIHFEGQSIKVLLPNTYMNESGRSIRAALDWFGLEVNQLLIVLDDMDLPLGRLRLRAKGSAGGHNGLRSTISHLGTQDFCRMRIGIGAPAGIPRERKSQTISHVLGSFKRDEVPIVNEVLDEVLIGFGLIQQLGLDNAANRLNAYRPKDS